MLVAQLLPAPPRPAPAPPRKAPGSAARASRTTPPIRTSTPPPRRITPRHTTLRRPHHPAAHHPAAGHDAATEGPDPDETAALELALIRREQTFDVATKVRAEDEREANVLRDMAMAQLKKDDENLKKWIALI